METKLILTQFGGTFGTLRFNGKSFFNTLLKFEPHWDFKSTNAIHADSPDLVTSNKVLKLGTINENYQKCNNNDGCVVNGIRQAILLSFL